VVLGSATPCLESLFNAKQKRFVQLKLPKRAGNATNPHFHLVDVRKTHLDEGFSSLILERMQHHLDQDSQILIFLNRRGYAPTLLCHHCGWIANCPSCDARLTYHSQLEKLVCHHCLGVRGLYKHCTACQSEDLLLLGLGTQRLEKTLAKRFPKIPLVRVDKDTTRRKGNLEKMLATVHNGSSQILIGTQMLAKGHHFPDVTMVVIIDIDNSLYSSDFRASERLGQIITQVAGRAGRSDKPGEVYLQTHNPEHPLLAQLLQSGYGNFAESLLRERKTAELPPYSHLALFRAEAADSELSHSFLKDVREILGHHEVQIFGPIPALIEKKAGKYRAHLLLQIKNRALLQKQLQVKINQIETLPSSRKVQWSLDIDPIEIF
jgi:primosomal protein N' (replication factor Y)